MPYFELLEGPAGRVYFSSLDIIVLLLMLAMSIRLFLTRRRKAYFSLTLTLLAAIAQHVLLIAADTAGDNPVGWTRYFAHLLKALSLILLNLSVYQLYNASRFRQYAIVWTAIILAVAVSLTRFAFGDFEGTEHQIRLLQDIGLELYLFLVLFLCYQWVTPWISQWGKYQFSLLTFFIYQLLHVVNVYMLDEKYPALSAVIMFFPVIYYGTLFLILFERVVDLLQSTYTKSITDALTGLYNRRFFMSRLHKYLNHGAPVSVIFCDIDNFKRLNDTQGHEEGDEALKKVAAILQEQAEEIGIAGRFGGEELVVMVSDPEAHAGEVAEDIRAAIEAEAGVTVSIGYSKARKGVSAETLVKQADEAMYQAKSTGKNKVCKYKRQKPIKL